jgi:hypothetical protein
MLKVSFCQTPYHLLEALAFYDDASEMIIVAPHGDRYRPLLAELRMIEFADVSARRDVLRRVIARGQPFDFYYATVWNRTALLFEKAALKLGGHINIFDDGAGGFGPIGNDWRRYVRKIAYAVLDGTQYCDHPKEKRFDPERTTFHSVVPELSPVPGKARQIDLSGFQQLMPRIAPHFEHLARYRGMPAFFDTADCESNWYPFEQKVEILRDLLPDEPTLYFPHPGQRLALPPHLPQLIDLSALTHGWNELACYFLKPPVVYSAFCTAAFTLSKLFGMPFKNVFFYPEFLERTGYRGFDISPSMRAYFACIS